MEEYEKGLQSKFSYDKVYICKIIKYDNIKQKALLIMGELYGKSG